MSSVSAFAPVSVDSPPEVSLFQLYLLRGAYLLLVVGLGLTVWPALIQHVPWAPTLCPWQGVGNSLLAALSLLAILGLRYPLKMLPLLLFEMTWKAIWLLGVALPVWMTHSQIGADMAQTIQACLMGIIFPIVIPWRYVLASFALQPGDRWKGKGS
jgi:hypothetical protein